MLIFEYKTNNNGKVYPVLYYLFKTGRRYRLTIPFIIIRGLIKNGIAKEIDNE